MANELILILQNQITKNAILIGSLGKGNESNHDIDVLLPNKRRTQKLKERLFELLESTNIEETDWNGWYFHDTKFGDVDVFFTIKYFDR